MTTDASPKTTMKTTSSSFARKKYQEILAKLDEIDKGISGFMFRLSLPPMVEAVYSVPANFFGLVPSLAIFPLWIALLALEDGLVPTDEQTTLGLQRQQQHHRNVILLKSITLLSSIGFLVAWVSFQKGYMPLTKILAQRYCYLLSICFNVGLLSYTLLQLPLDDPYAASSKKAFSLAIYLLFLWPPCILIVVILKEFSQRTRPIVLDTTRSGDSTSSDRWLDKKAFPNICYFLARAQANESFPSGDAASAAIFAILLVNIAPRYTTPAWSILVLACTGRMYVLAHYFFDVVAGSILACVIHRVASSVGLGIYDMQWWHPFASTMVLATYIKTMMKNKRKIG
jgi:membrane-associated phospholipid phosphatase